MGKSLFIGVLVLTVIFAAITITVQRHSSKVPEMLSVNLAEQRAANLAAYALRYGIKQVEEEKIKKDDIPIINAGYFNQNFTESPFNVLEGTIDSLRYTALNADKDTIKIIANVTAVVGTDTVHHQSEIAADFSGEPIEGLVGYWKMDEDSWDGTVDEVIDASTYDNHGIGEPTNGTYNGPTTISEGKYDRAGEFDGMDDYVDCGNDASLNITDAITIETWICGTSGTVSSQIETLRPDGAGDKNTWTSGTYSSVNDQSDITYLESSGGPSAPWQEGLFSTADHSVGSGPINWVRVHIRYKDDGTALVYAKVRTSMKINGTEYDGTEVTCSHSWANTYTEYATNPSTGSNWTWNEIDNIQIGADGQGVGPLLLPVNAQVAEVWLEVGQTVILRPDGAGDKNTWDSGTYSDVNDQSDATYLESSISELLPPWQEGLFSTENHSAGSGTINWVRVHIRYKDDATALIHAKVRTSMKTNGNEYDGAEVTCSASWSDTYTEYSTNPSTGSDWTWNEIDNIQIGADGQGVGPLLLPVNAQVAEVWLEVDCPVLATIVGKGTNAYELGIDTDSYIWGFINNQIVSSQVSAGWHHVALTYNKDAGSNQQKLYIDGSLAAQQTLTGPINTNTNNLLFGRFFKGTVDEVAIFNRALPVDEIKKVYLFGPARKILYWIE